MTGDSAKNLVDAGVDRFFVCGGRRVNVLPASDFREGLKYCAEVRSTLTA